MTAARRNVIIVAVLAVAAVVGVFLWRRGSTERPKVPTVGSAAPLGRPSGPRPTSAAGAGNVSNAGADAPLLVEDDPVGALRLEGQVIDDGDDPVGGATVVLSANPPRVVVTEADGSFAFDKLVGRPYTLVARAPAGAGGPLTVRVTDKTEPVILRLRAAAAATVSVVDDGGAPVGGATVELRGLDVQAATADKAGVATFATVVPGRYDLVAWAPGYARAFQFAAIAGPTNPHTITLRKGAPVSGRVVDATGKPVPETNVIFYGASDWSTQADERRDAATTDADGRFRFEALAAGSFRLVGRHPAHAPGTSEIITLDGVTPRDGVIITLPAGATVRGTVVDSAGAPVAGARVRIGVDSRGMVSDSPRQAYSGEGGTFVVEGLPRKALQAVAMHDLGASSTVPVDALGGDVSGVTLTLDVTGIIAGVVVDAAGEPLEGVQVSAGPSFGGGPDRRGPPPDMSQWRLRGFPQELTDAGGRFTLTGLAPGMYRVRATRSQAAPRGLRGLRDGTEVAAGTRDVRIVLQAEGGVTGKVALEGGEPPGPFTVSVGPMSEPVVGTGGAFTLEGLTPGEVELSVRGASFDGRSVKVTIEPAKIVDVGTITVTRGRVLAGIVLGGDGAPVAGATVHAGRQIFGNGSSSDAQFGGGPPMARGTKRATTDEAGRFTLAGFGPGDLTVVAEHPDVGRSKPLRVPAAMPGQDALTLTLEPFGVVRGVLRQGGQPVEGMIVTVQSVTSPGALYSVATGPDGGYRFDKLAPDLYKISAMVGTNPMMGMKFYSQQVEVLAGKEVVVELTVVPGAVSLAVTAAPTVGTIGIVTFWLASGTIAATSQNDLELKLAAAGPGSSQFKIAPFGGSQTFDELVAGAYTVCASPMPAEVQGMAGMSYAEKHGDTLPVFCKPVTITDSPAEQALTVTVTMPAFIDDAAGSGSGG